MPVKPTAINLVVLRSRDVNRARTFYRALSVEFAQHSHGRGPVHLANDTDGQVFEIYPLTEKDVATSSARIGFRSRQSMTRSRRCSPSEASDFYAATLSVGPSSGRC